MNTPALNLPEAPEPVLSTLNRDGSRRWLRPRPSHGVAWVKRAWTAYALMAVFVVLPHLRILGKPPILLDLPHREFTLFGTTFLPTETLLFMLLSVSALIAIFLATALFGRVWCGWGCPQTVYLEFLYRPIEYWIEGGPAGVTRLDRKPWHWRRVVKTAVFVVLSAGLAHTFLAYFVGTDELSHWMRRSPVEHPTSFFVMLGTTALMLFDFGWFREQTCLVACPYGRLQSVLLDRRSVIVGYDVNRGEPRGKGVKERAATLGDCIDCRMCVQTCPTGIDIRDGLQMECIHCTQCMDACDAVMTKVHRPIGLIRHGSRDELEGRGTRRLRARVVVYPLALALALGFLGWQLATRSTAEVTLLRGAGEPFTIDAAGNVVNQLRVKVTNRGSQARAYALALAGAPGARVLAPLDPLPVPAGGTRETSVFVTLPASAFPDGVREVTLRVDDHTSFARTLGWRLVGPEPESDVGRRR